jgi:hypothetical protein
VGPRIALEDDALAAVACDGSPEILAHPRILFTLHCRGPANTAGSALHPFRNGFPGPGIAPGPCSTAGCCRHQRQPAHCRVRRRSLPEI